MENGSLDTNYSFRWRHALIVLALALAFRGLYLGEASHKPDFNVFYMDEEYNLQWAKSLASGVWNPPYDQLRNTPYFRAPLYPLFLAGLFGLFGPNMLVARLVQLVLGSVSCVLAYGVAAKAFSERVGLVAGIGCSLYWVLAYFDSQFLQPVLLVFLLLCGLWLAFAAAERCDARFAGLAGLAFGLYAITRPEILVFAPFVGWWALKALRGAPARRARWFIALLALGFALPPVAATVRNGVVSGDWIVVASQGGVNFYIGNNPESNGMQAVVPGTHETWWGGFEDTKAIAEKAAGRPLKASEISNYWFRRGFGFIRETPFQWLKLTLRKALLFVGNVEIPNNEPYEAHRTAYLTLKSIPLGFGVLFGLFVVALPGMLGLGKWGRVGVGEGGGDRRAGAEAHRGEAARGGVLRSSFVRLILQFMLVYALTTIAFFVNGRYRVPLVPLVVMGSAVTVVAIWDCLRVKHLVRALAMVVAAGAIAGLLSVDYFGVRRSTAGFTEYTDALDILETGDTSGAIVRLEAIRREQSVKVPELYISLARAYVKRGRPEDKDLILAVAEDGLRYFPNEPELLWYAGLGHVLSKQWQPARERLEAFLSQKPGDLRALYLAFTVALAQDRRDDARALFKLAEAIDPTNPVVADMRSKLP